MNLRAQHADDMAGLVFRAASVGYGETLVVREVDLAVGRGELVGLVGPNGAGKSTLLRAVTGAADLLAGEIEVGTEPLHEMDARRRARTVAVVPQSPPLVFAFTSREFVALGRHAHVGRFEHLSRSDESIVEDAMRRTDTLRLAQERIDTLSGGDLQRLTLAQALAQQPQVLLLDEPTSHLDLNHRLQVLDLVRSQAAEGLTVLGVFHDLDLAARYSDRLGVVFAGRLFAVGRPDQVLTAEVVREVFAVRAVVGTDPVTGTVAVTPVVRDEAVSAVTRGRLFVVAGSGRGAALMRRLALDGWTVTAGALNIGDVDHSVASALDIEFVELPPYGAIDERASERLRSLAAQADVCVVSEVPFGAANLDNLEAVADAGRPTVLVGSIEGRDFAVGQAEAVWQRLCDRGVSRVATDAQVPAAVDGLLDSRA